LQAVGYLRLVAIATQSDAVIRLLHRPGHFVVAGQPLARVVPPSAVGPVSRALVRTHIVGPTRTLTQDPGFAIDQLVEVARRALSPAVNDTFTALNCIDWQREVILQHARMVLSASEESVGEESDRRDVQAAYDLLLAASNDMWDG